MLDLNLTHDERRSYHKALGRSHRMYVTVRILDRNEDEIASLTAPDSKIIDGQVVVDTSAHIKRSLNLSVLDPRHRFYLDPSSPRATALYPGLMVRVIRHDFVDELDDYVDCPVFWGPITRFERQGNLVSIDAVGKEVLSLEPHLIWKGFNIPKGRLMHKAIRDVLEAVGEERFSLPDGITRRLPRRLSLTRHDEAWREARRLAKAIDRQLFYDGRGRVRLRKRPTDPVFTFYATDRPRKPAPVVLSEPEVTFELTEFRNMVEVLGRQPSGRQKRPRYVARANRKHDLSSWSLRRGDNPSHIVEVIENDKIKRRSGAEELAKRRLKDLLRISVAVRFDSLCIPHLEEQDMVALVLEDDTIRFRMKQFTIPLSPSGVMSVGSLKRRVLNHGA